MSEKRLDREDAVSDHRAAGKSDRVCPLCARSLHWSRVYCVCGVDLRTGMPAGGADTAKIPVTPGLAQRVPCGAGNIRAISILMRSLSLIRKNKSVIGVHVGAMTFLGWVAGALIATSMVAR